MGRPHGPARFRPGTALFFPIVNTFLAGADEGTVEEMRAEKRSIHRLHCHDVGDH